MTNINKLTFAELDRLCAEAQGWMRYPNDSIEYGAVWHVDGGKPFGPTINIRDCTPTTNKAQAMELLEKFKVWLSDDEGTWIASCPPHCESSKEGDPPKVIAKAPIPSLAIARAVAAMYLKDKTNE